MNKHYVLAAATLLSCAGVAQADLMRFTFEGTISASSGQMPGMWSDVVIGDSFTVNYTFDTDALDSNPDPFAGVYLSAITGFEVLVGDTFGASSDGLILVEQGDSSDMYSAISGLAENVTALISINDQSQGLLSSDDLPSGFVFPEGVAPRFTLSFGSPLTFISGSATTFTASMLPAPGALALLGIAGGLSRRRRRR